MNNMQRLQVAMEIERCCYEILTGKSLPYTQAELALKINPVFDRLKELITSDLSSSLLNTLTGGYNSTADRLTVAGNIPLSNDALMMSGVLNSIQETNSVLEDLMMIHNIEAARLARLQTLAELEPDSDIVKNIQEGINQNLPLDTLLDTVEERANIRMRPPTNDIEYPSSSSIQPNNHSTEDPGIIREIYETLKKYGVRPLNPTPMGMITPFGLNPNDISLDNIKRIKDDVRNTVRLLFDKIPENVLRDLKTNAFEASARTLDLVTGNVKDVLRSAVRDGVGIRDAAIRLTDAIEVLDKSHLELIARTEINRAQNRSTFDMERSLDIKYHMWISAEDDRVRGNNSKDEYDHTYLHGQIVEIGEPFSNGLLYPGDTSGDIGDWINCRCREIPFIMPYLHIAPPGESYFWEDDIISIE